MALVVGLLEANLRFLQYQFLINGLSICLNHQIGNLIRRLELNKIHRDLDSLTLLALILKLFLIK